MAERPILGKVMGDLHQEDFADPIRELLPFKRCASATEARALLRENVTIEVSAMIDLLHEADAFDVVELIRMREFPVVPDPRAAPTGGSAVVVELVSALLLARGSRKPHPIPREQTRPHEVIEELHQRCKKLARLASYRALVEGDLRNGEPLARLASEYQGASLNIRNMQYDHIRDKHDRQLFETPVVSELMLRYLGYTYADVLAVRSAMTEISATRMTKLRDDSANLMLRHGGINPTHLSDGVAQAFAAAMIPFIFLPADRAVISPTDIAAISTLDIKVVRRVLESFAQSFDSSVSAEDRVFDLLMGKNTFLASPLLSDGVDAFALTSNDIGLDALRRILERALPPNSSDVRKYDQKARQQVSESLAVSYLQGILGARATHVSYHYWAPKAGIEPRELGSDCKAVKGAGDRVEGDALFIVDDVAFVVEVKAKSIADQARRGDVRRLSNDLKATIGDGAKQTGRLGRLLETNKGFWSDPENWVDLSHVREVRSVVVVLDDVGPLGTNLEDLRQAGLVPEQLPPLVLSLHDLAAIAEVGERPSEFLLYLRRRTDSPVRTYFRALDELDLYMLFLAANLYVADDPDRVRQDQPAAAPASKRQRREYRESAVGTLVTDNCAELNAWMIRDKLPVGDAPEKPAMNAPLKLLVLIDELQAKAAPGWLRCSADMLALSGESQRRVIRAVSESVRTARSDGGYHDAVISFAGLWGHAVLFIGAYGPKTSRHSSLGRLENYARTKQYQLQADRGYAWLFDHAGQLEGVLYLDRPPLSDPELDRRVSELRLRPVGVPVSPLPPSARRMTKRLKGKRTKR